VVEVVPTSQRFTTLLMGSPNASLPHGTPLVKVPYA
jgi:hypothetical protein